MLGKRRRQGDQDRFDLAQGVVVGGRPEAPGLDQRPEHARGNVLDVAVALVDAGDALGADVDEQNLVSGLDEDLSQGDADIAGTDDRDLSGHLRAIPYPPERVGND